jgi:predicted nucleic acid-binding protein
MGLIIDTGIFVQMEKAGHTPDFGPFAPYGEAFISAITVSELLVGVHCADRAGRRAKRSAFVESIIGQIPSVRFTQIEARTHARLSAELQGAGKMIGAHDLLIAAIAVAQGHAVLSNNEKDFKRVPGLTVLTLPG